MTELSADAGLGGLFLSAFVSATVLPGSSEIVLVALLAKFPELFWQSIAVATLGNSLGGMTAYGIGRVLPNRVENRALTWLRRYGEWLLLLSWVPLIGDALCVAAGWLRINPWLALLMLASGKFARYVLVASGWSWIASTWLS